jgi:hypothetical protein
MRHFAAALRKLCVAPDVGPEFEAPLVFDRERHVDELGPKTKLQARLPLAAVPDAALVGIAPRLQLVGRHVPVR